MSRSHGEQTGDLAHSSDGTSCDRSIAIVIFRFDFTDGVLVSSVTYQPVTKLTLEYHMLTGALFDQSYNSDDDDDREA